MKLCRRHVLDRAALLLCLPALNAAAQAPSPARDSPRQTETSTPAAPSFDVASIHEHKEDDGNMMWRPLPDGMSTVNIPLQNLISSAYRIKMDIISGGPSWVENRGFDISAKVLDLDPKKPAQLTEDTREAMLRSPLADRFHLQAHIETKILPIYELVIAKGGPKMQPAPPEPPDPDSRPGKRSGHGSMSFGPGHLEVKRYLISDFAPQLGYTVHRTVLDHTGLTGQYNFTLDWMPEEQLDAGGANADSGAEIHPPIFTALQDQLGLKLVPARGPVNTLVIDHVEMPTPN